VVAFPAAGWLAGGMNLDRFHTEVASAVVGLSANERIAVARESAERLSTVLAAIERGELDATAGEVARLQGAAMALAAISG